MRILIQRSGEFCLVGLILGIIAKSIEPVVLGYSHTVLSMEIYHSADRKHQVAWDPADCE